MTDPFVGRYELTSKRRSSPTVRFRFDGRDFTGIVGDTLASALIANGVHMVGRSFKYHRPRGIYAAGIDEPNALVTIVRGTAREPNLQATLVEIFEGMVAESQNRFPSLHFDLGSLNQLAGPMFAAGFYYKTFMGPRLPRRFGTSLWMLAEHVIRRAAGLGRAGPAIDNANYDSANAFCDLLIVGAGPSGIEAAISAADRGKRVILCDLAPRLGGSALSSGDPIAGRQAEDWVRSRIEILSAKSNVTILCRTAVWGYYDGNLLAATQRLSDHEVTSPEATVRQRLWRIRARDVVLATGALERPILFPDNDRPGIMLSSAAQYYATVHGTSIGREAVLFTNNDVAYHAAKALVQTGTRVSAIIDARPKVADASASLSADIGARLLLGHGIVATKGRTHVRSVTVSRIDSVGRPTGPLCSLSADTVLVSGGWSPTIHLATQAGGAPKWNDDQQAFLPPEPSQKWAAAGAITGLCSTEEAVAQGAAVIEYIYEGREPPNPGTASTAMAQSTLLAVDAKGKVFVDLQHDVTTSDIRLAHREGFTSIEHVKRYTTLGMATDQGKTSNVLGMSVLASASGVPIAAVGTTRFRPPFAGVSIGSLAGSRYGHVRPTRLTPMHDWHERNGAIMYAAGLWQRPMIYRQGSETIEAAYIREAANVRLTAGIVDVSTLGKISVQGPDAAEFLDRVYTNMFSTLPVGKARYGLMLREDGILLDDGTTWRLADDDFMMTTTTANGGKVLQHLEYFLQVVWPDLRAKVTSVTDQWAALALAGPRSRDILQLCMPNTSVDRVSMPQMAIARGEIAEVPVMVCRLSFSGELAYEIYCEADYGEWVWSRVLDTGAPLGLRPYGLEALGALRIEKGHVTGSELDGRTTAADVHLGKMLSKKKPFIGSAMLAKEGMNPDGRMQLVGLISGDGKPLAGGSHVVAEPDRMRNSIGHVTAACFSPALNKYVGLALVRDGLSRHGSLAFVSDPVRSRFGPVQVVSHLLFDPEGARQNG